MKYYVRVNEEEHEVAIAVHLSELQVTVDGEPFDLVYEEVDALGQVLALSDGKAYGASIEGSDSRIDIVIAGRLYEVEIEDERERAAHAAADVAGRGGGVVNAVMPGVVVDVLVSPGDEVAEGQPLLLLEAMKMQNEIPAPSAGTVEAVHVEPGRAVAAGEKLITLGAAAAG